MIQEADDLFAALFDPVGTSQLEKMFPTGKWSKWTVRAKANGLLCAKVARAKFNPYRAAMWWLKKRNPAGWDLSKCSRVLANNLPARSIDSRYLLTGVIE